MTTINPKQRAAERLALLEERLIALLAYCERLQAENRALRAQQAESPPEHSDSGQSEPDEATTRHQHPVETP